jgi:nitrite reductase/ring-hydroxylating ferredoxin subunit
LSHYNGRLIFSTPKRKVLFLDLRFFSISLYGYVSNGSIVTCPFHGARFDVTTGKKIKEPVLTPSQQMEPLPKSWQNYLEHAGELMSYIKTYDQQTYEVRVEDNKIKIRI